MATITEVAAARKAADLLTLNPESATRLSRFPGSFFARIEPGWLKNDLRCATGTPTPVAQIKRKSTRKPSANQRANHFPKDIRYSRNEAQTILPAAQAIFAGRANHFAHCANHFCLQAQIIW
jgi:hypothetical protein